MRSTIFAFYVSIQFTTLIHGENDFSETHPNCTTKTTVPVSCSNDEEVNFSCTERGRFTHLNDATCTKYFLCSRLRNGTFIQTPRICPNGSFFDPARSICSTLYDCPCLETSLSPTTQQTTLQLGESTCKLDESEFTCEETGRFRNQGDSTCTKWYLCSLLQNGTLLRTEYTCPDGSYFDDYLSLCTEVYQCPCGTTTSAPTIPTTVPTPTTETSITPSTTIGTTTISSTPIETTSASPECATDEDPNFVCTEKGRFKKPNDLSCTQYYLCSLLRNGTYLQTEYTCPSDGYFDPSISICNSAYQCTCSTTYSTSTNSLLTFPSTTTSTTSTATTTTENTPSTSTISTTSTTTISSTPVETTTASPECATDQDPNFVCTEKGRFKKPNDLSCTKYFLCSLLRNGTYLQTEYPCPSGSYFDQLLGICDTDYQCPCTSSSTAASTSITIPSTISPDTTTSTPTTIISSTNSGSSSTSTSPPSTTTISSTPVETTTASPECATDRDPNFVCTEKGRFKKPNDITCTEYFLCSFLRNGTYLQTAYTCPSGSYFDQSLTICDTNYQCPCTSPNTASSTSVTVPSSTSPDSTISTTTSSSTAGSTSITIPSSTSPDTTASTTTSSSIASSTAITVPSSTSSDTTTSTITNTITSTTSGSPGSSTSTPGTTTIASTAVETSTASAECATDQEPNFVCTEKGRFKKPNDITCTEYFLCSLLRNGTYLQTAYTCPSGSYFDQSLTICDTNYECPCTSPSTASSTSVTVPSSTSPDSTISTTTSSSTAGSTSITIPSSTSPETTSSTTTSSSTPSSTSMTLPSSSSSDTTTSTTTNTITSTTSGTPSSSTSAPGTTTISSTPVGTSTASPECATDQDPNFVCAEKGRFKKPNDITCTEYFLCSLLRNGTYLQTAYTCPSGSYFDQSLTICDTNYECPCTSSTTTASSTSITVPSSTSSDTTTSRTSVTTTTDSSSVPSTSTSMTSTSTTSTSPISSTTIETTIASQECATNQDPNFVCTEKGRFKKPNDLTCSWYYLCTLLRNGTYLQTEYPCPSGSYFDQSLSICDTNYECPCNSVTTDSTLPSSTSTIPAASSTTAVPEECTTAEDPNFECTQEGRFRKPNDLSCSQYYLCTLLNNGTFIQTEYPCPSNSYFDPSASICSTNYICPCELIPEAAQYRSHSEHLELSSIIIIVHLVYCFVK